MKSTLLSAAFLAIALGCAPSAPVDLTEEDRAAIRQLFDDLAASLSPEDNDAWSQLYTEDAQFMFEATPTIRGREQMREWGETDSPVALSASFSDLEIHGAGDWAWATSNYVISVEGVEGPVAGKHLLIVQRQADGRWLFAAGHASSDAPLPGN